MQMLIGGHRADASDRKTIQVYNPATLEIVDCVPAATHEDIDTVLNNALSGAKAWGGVPLHRRIEVIRAFLERYNAQKDDLADLLLRETGKTIPQAKGCIYGSLALAEHYTELARTMGGESFPTGNRPDTEGAFMFTVREPLGVVACILPYNFPIDSYMHKVIPSLLMGNAVVVKPASDTPLTDIRVTELLLESGVPGNALQLVTGSGAKIGAWLTSDPRVNMVNLTGSTPVGKQIAEACAQNLTRVHLELGGNDAFVILPDADLERAALEAFNARIGNCGQVCCAAKRFLIQRDQKDAFIARLKAHLKTVKVGNPVDPQVNCGPLISTRAADELERNLAHCVKQGAQIVYGGKRLGPTYYEPTILEVSSEVDAAHNLELFGPVWSILPYETVDEAVRLANDTVYGLSAGVIGKDMRSMLAVAAQLQAGGCVVNGAGAFRSSDQPFGGYKHSGIGREGGRYTLEEMSQVKTIILKM